jgi:hypothetical protein
MLSGAQRISNAGSGQQFRIMALPVSETERKALTLRLASDRETGR